MRADGEQAAGPPAEWIGEDDGWRYVPAYPALDEIDGEPLSEPAPEVELSPSWSAERRERR